MPENNSSFFSSKKDIHAQFKELLKSKFDKYSLSGILEL